MHKVFALLFTVFVAFTANAQDKLPDVKINDLDGQAVNIADFGEDEKITIFSFWATWCSPCKKELNNLVDLYDEWLADDLPVEIVAVSIDDQRNVSKIKPYVNGQSWEYTVLLDTNQDFMRSLGIQNVPFTIIVDQNGEIVYRHSGYVEGDEYEVEEKILEMVE